MRKWSLFIFVFTFACSPAPALEEGEGGGETKGVRGDTPPAYRDVEETFTSEREQDRWFELRRALRDEFDQICGDTFCEGDFTNLEAMSFRCSASTRTGLLRSCVWLFAGSYETVTASTGNIRPVARFFTCKVPVQGRPIDLAEALLAPGGEGPLRQPLPGQTQSIYDVIGSCL